MGEDTIEAIDDLRVRVELFERSLEDPLLKNWLHVAALALMCAEEQLGKRW
jgi:hypothetical protein